MTLVGESVKKKEKPLPLRNAVKTAAGVTNPLRNPIVKIKIWLLCHFNEKEKKAFASGPNHVNNVEG